MEKLRRYSNKSSFKNLGAGITQINTKTKPAIQKINALNGALAKTGQHTRKLGDSISKVTRILTISYLTRVYHITKRIGTAIYDLVKLYAEYVENINLATVAYRGLENASSSLYPFVEQISSAFGLNESEVTRSVGLFKQMANAMGLAQDTGELLSETLTKMAYDISSLYNISFERSMSVLQASLAGQTKPIRGATGADITESSLRKTLENIGIKKEIRDLTYVEKRLLIVISLTQQLNLAQGDLARTIESTANQLKIMQQQLSRVKIALGDFFNIFAGKILPYLNGFLMALVEIIKYITKLVKSLLGIQDIEYDYSNVTGTGDNEYIDELTDGLEEANEQAEKLKKNLIGIDELNILQPQEEEDNTGLDIDPAILNAFTAALSDWDNKMDEVDMKANKIRDTILSWFGLEPQGDVWGLKEGSNWATRIKEILESIDMEDLRGRLANILGYLGKALAILTLIKIVTSPFLLFLSGIMLILDGLNNLLGESKELSKGLTKILSGVGLILLGLAIKFGNFPLLVAAAIAGGLAWFVSQLTDEEIETYLETLRQKFIDFSTWLSEKWNEFIENLPNISDILSGLGVGLILPFVVGLVAELLAVFTDFKGKLLYGAANVFLKYEAFFGKLAGVGLIILGIGEALRGVYKIIQDNQVTLESLSNILKGIGLIIAGIGILTGNPIAIAIGAIVAVVGFLADETNETGKAIMSLWENVLKPVIDKLWTELKRIWEKLKPALQALWKLIKAVWDVLMVVVQLIVDLLGPAVEWLASMFIDVFGGAIEVIVDILNFFITILGGVADFIAGIFTGNIKRALSGIGNIFVGFINGIIAVIEAGINFIIIVINAVTGFVLSIIQGIWNTFAGVLEVLAKFIGVTVDIKWKGAVPQIPLVSLKRVPAFENGGYPNKGMFLMNEGSSAEMVGSIGGRTAVVNNQEIAEALAIALKPLLGTVVTAIEDVAATDRPIVLNVDSRDIARANNTGSQKLGISQIGGVFANV